MQWPAYKKIAFRFLSIYLFLFIMSNQFILSGLFNLLWQELVPWFGETILQLPEMDMKQTGSGDKMYNWVSILVYAVIALIGTIVWSILDKKRPNYQVLLNWLLVLVRYYLIWQMCLYGLAKLFYMQFQPPSLGRLIEPFGDFSPMAVLWTFMGYSKSYTFFAGLGELVGGLLLLSRKTQTLGAIIVLGVMSNVMAMNFFYDVPVKILSTHLVLLALFLIAIDFQRIYRVFILNEATEPMEWLPYTTDKEFIQIKNYLKWGAVILGLGFFVFISTTNLKKYGPNAAKPPLYGLYEVDTYIQNGIVQPPLLTDTIRWRRLLLERRNNARIYQMDDSRDNYRVKTDTVNHWLKIKAPKDTVFRDSFKYNLPTPLELQLNGIFQGDTLDILLKKQPRDSFPLIKRGFHWVNEYPLNR